MGSSTIDPAKSAPSAGGVASEQPGRSANGSGRRAASGDLATQTFQTRDVVEIVGVSRRQLQYWAHTRLIAPSSQTQGGHGRYTFEDLVALKAAKRLINAGISVQRIRDTIRELRKILPTVRRPLAELVLVATGDVILAFRDGTAFDAVSGQEWIFEVAQFQREIEDWKRSVAKIRRTRRPRETRSARTSRRTA